MAVSFLIYGGALIVRFTRPGTNGYLATIGAAVAEISGRVMAGGGLSGQVAGRQVVVGWRSIAG